MSYIEIMDFCGYDLDRANELAHEEESKHLAEIIDEIMRETGLDRAEVQKNVYRI